MLRWSQRSEIFKTVFLLSIVTVGTLSGYGLFMLAMGTNSPLVVVTSESMVPTLQVGDLLVLQHRAKEDIMLNDIIVFTASWYTKAPIVHRVIQIEIVNGEYRYYTKGDNNNYVDLEYRTYEDIIGVVVFRIPLVGHVSMFLQTLYGRAIVILIIIGLVLLPSKEEIKRGLQSESKSPSTESSQQ